MTRLDDRIVLVTGGARGRGAAEAERCAAEGATVWITDVLDAEGEKTAADIGATYRHHDVVDAQQWQAVTDEIVAAHGRLDGLVNNAGIFRHGGLAETDEDLYRQVVDINQIGVFLGMRSVAPAMVASGAGSIVNISSIAGLMGTPTCIAYGASKWAVRGMTKAAARELAASGVRVNSVHPGLIDTAMLEYLAGSTEAKDALAELVPMGRLADAYDVADVVLFLLSDDSRYCTGQEFVVDGGVRA
jgi:3alpha(or 20beta)-hydroxysteroid dehydrogenase